MKRLVTLLAALAVAVVAFAPASALACNKDKAKSTSASAAKVEAAPAAKGAKVTAPAVMASTGKVEALPAGASCHSESGASAKSAHGDCTACADMANCEGELATVGAHMQVVPLKNGVMYVYTAEGASKVHAVQASLARRTERLTAMVASGDKAALCGECKSMRGAMASGKLSREVVNIEGGCLTLVTSNDPTMVSKIHAMAGIENANRKS